MVTDRGVFRGDEVGEGKSLRIMQQVMSLDWLFKYVEETYHSETLNAGISIYYVDKSVILKH